MFNFLMGANGWQERGDTLSYSRYYGKGGERNWEFTDSKASETLLALPALFMPEVSGEGQTARVGKVVSASRKGKEIDLELWFDSSIPPIPVPKIVGMARELDISTDGFMLNHTHWAVHDVDLFRVLFQHQVGTSLAPTVFDLDHDYDPNLVGVMMPFDAGFNPVYKAIKKGVTDAGHRCERADNLWLHSTVVQTIVSLICQSGIVIADCSKKNANVFYEAGIAHTIGKEVILLAQHIDDVPFDLRHISIITYHANDQGYDELGEKVKRRIAQITNPRRRA